MSLSNCYCMALITFNLGHYNLFTLSLESGYVLPITNQCTCPFVEEWRSLRCTQKTLKIINWWYCMVYSKIAIPYLTPLSNRM